MHKLAILLGSFGPHFENLMTTIRKKLTRCCWKVYERREKYEKNLTFISVMLCAGSFFLSFFFFFFFCRAVCMIRYASCLLNLSTSSILNCERPPLRL